MSALESRQRRKPRIGLVAGGLGTYWPQFPGLLPQLQQSAAYVSERFEAMGADVTDVGFISDAEAGAAAAERLRAADCDLIVLFLTTYLTSSMVLPIAQRAHAPVLDGSLSFIASEGVTVPGPLLAIGNTTSRVDFGRDPGEWVDEWSATGVRHHWSLSVGHRSADYEAAASLLGIDFRQV